MSERRGMPVSLYFRAASDLSLERLSVEPESYAVMREVVM